MAALADPVLVHPPPARPEHTQTKNRRLPQSLLHVLLIIFSGGALRLLYQTAFKPFWGADSNGYAQMFYWWTLPTFSVSERPPLYALFLGLMQKLAGDLPAERMGVASQYLAAHVQSVLGIVAALGVYASLRSLNLRPRISLAGALAFSLIGAICLFELYILTELLSLLLIVFASCFFLRALRALSSRRPLKWPALFSGLAFGLAVLTRPENLVFFLAVVTLVMLLCLRTRFRVSLRWATRPLARLAGLLVVSAAPLVLLWMTWTLLNIGEFRLNTITGITRTESVYNLFDRVEPADHVVGELLNASYIVMNHNGAVYRQHAWFAMPPLLRAAQSGRLPVRVQVREPSNSLVLKVRHSIDRRFGMRPIIQYVDLYDYLGDLSGRLARRYPSLYLQNVADNFLHDTFSFSYLPPDPAETHDPQAPEGGTTVRNLQLYKVTVFIDRIEAPLLSAGYIVLIGFVLSAPVALVDRSDRFLFQDAGVITLAVSTFSVVVASCVVAAYYPQHGIPFFAVLIICVCFVIEHHQRILRALRRRSCAD